MFFTHASIFQLQYTEIRSVPPGAKGPWSVKDGFCFDSSAMKGNINHPYFVFTYLLFLLLWMADLFPLSTFLFLFSYDKQAQKH